MWWIPVILAGSYMVKKVYENYELPQQNLESVNSILELNLQRLNDELEKSTTQKIAIIGQPGSGKSTLLRTITKGKCTPLPFIGQKTDATAWDNDLEVNLFHCYENLKFVDAPGYDTTYHPVESYLKYFPFSTFDKLIFVVSTKIHDSDVKIFDEIVRCGLNKMVVVRACSDGLNDYEGAFEDFDNIFNIKKLNLELIFFSSKTQEGCDRVIEFCKID